MHPPVHEDSVRALPHVYPAPLPAPLLRVPTNADADGSSLALHRTEPPAAPKSSTSASASDASTSLLVYVFFASYRRKKSRSGRLFRLWDLTCFIRWSGLRIIRSAEGDSSLELNSSCSSILFR